MSTLSACQLTISLLRHEITRRTSRNFGPQHVRYRIICLTGVSPAGAEAAIDPGQLNRNMVLQNSVLFGSVNAIRHHYELAAEALAQADPGWLADLITRQVPLGQWVDAYTRRPDDIKTILSFADESP